MTLKDVREKYWKEDILVLIHRLPEFMGEEFYSSTFGYASDSDYYLNIDGEHQAKRKKQLFDWLETKNLTECELTLIFG